MPYGECGDQYNDLTPVLNEVGTTESDDKKNMVIPRKVQDVLQTQRKINPKILHDRCFVRYVSPTSPFSWWLSALSCRPYTSHLLRINENLAKFVAILRLLLRKHNQ